MTLQDWFNNGWLKKHESTVDEVSGLMELVERDISQAGNKEISSDYRLAIAYNACRTCARIALHANGYRVSGGAGEHYRTIQSLKFTINPDQDLIVALEAIAKQRGIAMYDAAGAITDAAVDEALQLAKELRELLLHWLKESHPSLLSE